MDKYLKIGLLALAALSVTLWHSGYLILFWDQTYPLGPSEALVEFFQYWHTLNFGSTDASGFAFLPYFLFIYIFSLDGEYIFFAQYLLNIVLFSSGLLTSYELFKYLLARINNEVSWECLFYASFLGAISYGFSLFSLVYIWRILNTSIFLFAFAPLIMLLFCKWLEQKNAVLMIKVLLVTFLVVPNLTNIAFMGALGACLALIWLTYTILTKSYSVKFVVKSLAFFLLFILFHSWWLMPQLLSANEISERANHIGYEEIVAKTTKNTKIHNLLKNTGMDSLYDDPKESPTPYWGRLYTEAGGNYFIYLPFFLSFIVFFAYYRMQKSIWITLLMVLLLASIFLIKGPNAPVGFMNEKLYSIHFYALAYRAPYSKIGLFFVIAYSALLAVGLSSILTSLKSRGIKRLVPVACIAILLLLYGYPLLNGDVVPSGHQGIPGARISLPEEYKEVSNYLRNTKTNGRVLSLPYFPHIHQSSVLDMGHTSKDLIYMSTYKPYVIGIAPEINQNRIVRELSKSIEVGNFNLNILNTFNIDYILVKKDINLNFYKGATIKSPEIIDNILKNKDFLLPVIDNKRVTLYSVANPSDVITLTNSVATIAESVDSPSDQILNKSKFIRGCNPDANEIGHKKTILSDISAELTSENDLLARTTLDAGDNKYLGVTFKSTDSASIYINMLAESGDDLMNVASAPINPPVYKENIIDDRAHSSSDYYTLIYNLNNAAATPEIIEVRGTNHFQSNKNKPTGALVIKDIFLFSEVDESCFSEELVLRYPNSDKYTYKKIDLLNFVEPMSADDLGYLMLNVKTNNHSAIMLGIKIVDPGGGTRSIIMHEYDDHSYQGNAIQLKKGIYNTAGSINRLVYNIRENIEDATVLGLELYLTNRFFIGTQEDDLEVVLYDISAYRKIGSSLDIFDELATTPTYLDYTYSQTFDSLLNNYSPKIEKKLYKYNLTLNKNTKKIINVSNLDQQFFLIFKDNFHPDWRLSVGSVGEQNARSIEVKPFVQQHFVANGFANAWFVDLGSATIDNTKNQYQLIIEFPPQRWFYLGLLISGTTFAGCIVYLGYDFVRRRKRKKLNKANADESNKGDEEEAGQKESAIVGETKKRLDGKRKAKNKKTK
jgi:hypothetical protein